MSKPKRTYERQDFSELLVELREEHEEKKDRPEEKVRTPLVTKEYRRRASLMDKYGMKYAISTQTGEVHDRECPRAASIPDHAFDMIAEFPEREWRCRDCYHKALIRKGLIDSQIKRIDAYCYVFKKLGATDWDMRTLMCDYNAKLWNVERDHVNLKVEDYNWVLRRREQKCVLEQCSNAPQSQWPRHESSMLNLRRSGTFHECINAIKSYTILLNKEADCLRSDSDKEQNGKKEGLTGRETADAAYQSEEKLNIVGSKEVSEARQRRIRLLLDPNMKYVFCRATKEVHDRSCSKIAEISDEDFDMLPEFPVKMWICSYCYRRAMIRCGIEESDTQKLYEYYRILDEMGASEYDLRRLMIDYGAKLYGLDQNRIFIKTGERKWTIRLKEDGCLLHYVDDGVHDQDKILTRDGALLRLEVTGSFAQCVARIIHYDDYLKSKERLIYHFDLKTRNKRARNYEKLRKFSLLHDYYIYADCINRHRALGWEFGFQMDIEGIARYPDTRCTAVVCKIKRWQRKRFEAAMSAMKIYSIFTKCDEYASFCKENILKEMSLKAALQNVKQTEENLQLSEK